MGEGRGATGLSSEVTVSLFRPARNTLLVFLFFATGAAIWFGVKAGAPLWMEFVLKLAVMLVTAALLALSQYRAPLFALSIVFAVLPGAAFAFAVTALATTSIPAGLVIALAAALGFAVALSSAERFALRVIESEDPEREAVTLLFEERLFLVSIVIVAAAAPAVTAIASPRASLFDTLLFAGCNAAAAFCAWVAVPLLCSFLRVSEDFIASTNRIRESWTRRLDGAAAAARSPWAWSAAGILVVLLALAFFGSTNIQIAGGVGARLGLMSGAAAAVVLIGALVAARDVRRAVATSITTLSVLAFEAWGFARLSAPLDGATLHLGAALLAIGFVAVSATAAAAARSARAEAAGASKAGVFAAGPSAATGMLGALAFVALWFPESGTAWLGALLALVFAGAGALVFQPALACVLETLAPRRKTIAERYRVK
jgi:hypothetical protein